jgi:hypothetical protein
MAPIGLGLRMNVGITIDLGGGGLKDTSLNTLGQTKTVDGSDDGGLHRLDRIILVVRRGCRASEIINTVDLELEGIDHIMAYQFKAGIPHKMLDISLATGEEIVKADDFMPLFDEPIAKMGTEKSGSSGNEDTHRNKLKEKY